ncbi:MAG: ferritin-like domain-containing protein [Planctomycetaceae bacterium]
MRRGYLKWKKKSAVSQPAGFGLMALAGGSAGGGSDREGMELPASDHPLTPHDELVFLLHSAAEVEHALLVQYLYAAFSFGDPTRRTIESGGDLCPARHKAVFGSGGWNETITQIAREEMGHLLTVQNILRVIGGPLNMEREDFPFRGDFYPFPLTLESATKDSLAKYVAAEMPESPAPHDYPLMNEILLRAKLANEGAVNRVGNLYAKIIALAEKLTPDDFRPETADQLQGNWGGQVKDETSLPLDKRLIMGVTFRGTGSEAKQRVLAALRTIAEQGEGPDTSSIPDPTDSHFDLFYKIYRDFPESNPRYGVVKWHAALPVPLHPTTNPDTLGDAEQEDGRITDDGSRAWAHTFNARYRILLMSILHSLSVDRTQHPREYSTLNHWIFREMLQFLRPISNVLTRLPRQSPNIFEAGRAATAGAPFELPYSLNLPDQEVDRWRMHRDVVESSMLVGDQLPLTDDPASQTLQEQLRQADADSLWEIAKYSQQRVRAPRIFFQGEFRTNVATANNNDANFLDTVFVKVLTQGMTDDAFRAWLKDVPAPGGRIRSGWNLFGDNEFSFENVTITAVETTDGSLVSNDPLVGQPVQLDGVMVDLNPEAVIDTQIFAKQLIAGTVSSVSGKPNVLHSRWLSFGRNQTIRGPKGASAVFRSVIPINTLHWSAIESDLLEQLRHAVAVAGGGLAIEFCTYFTGAKLSNAELLAKYQAGEEVENPAFGRIVGCLSPATASDLTTIPAGRRLNPTEPAAGQPAAIGPAFADVDPVNRVIRLNLITAIPEKDETLAKADFGTLTLQARRSTDVVSLGSVAYDQATYEATAGQVRVSFPQAADTIVADGLLEIVSSQTGGAILSEVEWVFESDERNQYVEVGTPGQITLRGLHRGQVPTTDLELRVSEYVELDVPAQGADQIVTLPATVNVQKGRAEVPFQFSGPGTRRMVFDLPASPVGPVNGITAAFANVRSLPVDDYDGVADADVTFAKVYDEILRYYHLIHPAMSALFPLNDEATVKSFASGILERINPSLHDDVRYMPRTRDLSAGKRKLLERWCRKVLPTPGTGRFSAIKKILDESVNNENFGGPHGPFWRSQTRNQFVSFEVPIGGGRPPVPLLVVGDAAASNLIKALKGEPPFGNGQEFPRMPFGFAPLPPEKIAIVEQWINDDCPDDTPGGPGGSLSFERDIKSLFRPQDVQVMKNIAHFDLSKFEDVAARADDIHARVADGSMPCDGAWPAEQVAKFKLWIDQGKQP